MTLPRTVGSLVSCSTETTEPLSPVCSCTQPRDSASAQLASLCLCQGWAQDQWGTAGQRKSLEPQAPSLPSFLSLLLSSLLGQPWQRHLLQPWGAQGRQGRASRELLQLLSGLKERLRGCTGNKPTEIFRQCQARWALATVISTPGNHDFLFHRSGTLHSCLHCLCQKLDLSQNRKF